MLETKRRLIQLLEPAELNDPFSKIIDLFLIGLIFINIGIVYAYSFHLPSSVFSLLHKIETGSVIIFTVEYLLRLWISDVQYESKSSINSRLKYVFSLLGLADLLAVIAFYLPLIMPFDLIVLKAIRVIRLLQIFKLNRYTSSTSSIWLVIQKKSAQLISSLLAIFTLIAIVSLMMYSVEHSAQPNVFQNAFSGIWWAIETLTTVGYGDIYPITALGKVLASIISLLGIGLVAVPTAIISSGFIEQMDFNNNKNKDHLYCPYCGKKLR